MDCPRCRSHILDTWNYCPRCGTSSSAAEQRPSNALNHPSHSLAQISPWKLLDQLSVGLVFITPRRRIGHINSAARALFEIEQSADLVGKPFHECLQHAACIAIINRRLAQGACLTTDEISISEGRFCQVHSSHIHDGDAAVGTYFMFQDVTDLHIGERMKRQFISCVSHDLRVPLTPLKGFIHALLGDEDETQFDRETRHEFYSILDVNVDRMSVLLKDFLNETYMQSDHNGICMYYEEGVDLKKLAEEVVAVQKRRTCKHTFVIDFQPAEILLEADPDKLQNVLHNFVSNAIKYSTNGGQIIIMARLKPADDIFPYDTVQIGVRDQGMGISQRDLIRIGQKFYRTDNPAARRIGGTGIGLYLVKALIEAHKGYMTVESELGKGSTFWMCLPLRCPTEEVR